MEAKKQGGEKGLRIGKKLKKGFREIKKPQKGER